MISEKPHTFGLITVLGFSFWFLLAFPFGNHNESYRWLVSLDTYGMVDWLTKWLHGSTFRPLGQLTAWATYSLSGGSTYPIQMLNYILAVLAWLLAFYAAKERRVFALLSLLAGSVFFSGYIYLFHIHGVFYSPVLILIALALQLSSREVVMPRQLLGIALLSLVISLFHPFAVLVGLATIFGLAMDKKPFLKKVGLSSPQCHCSDRTWHCHVSREAINTTMVERESRGVLDILQDG